MNTCEQCGEPISDNAKPCPWSGLMLCDECGHDEGIAAEERHYERLDQDQDEEQGTPIGIGWGRDGQ